MTYKFLIRVALFISAIITLTSCEAEDFTINGDLSELGTQNLRMVYITSDAIKSNWQPAVDHKFSFTGISKELTVVEIFNRQMEVLARAAVKNGDKIEVAGNMREPYSIEVTGTKINKDWSGFINKYADLLTKRNKPAFDIEVEKYVRANPDNLVSALLIAYNYANASNIEKTRELLDLLPENVKPEFIMQRIQSVSEETYANA